jgi:hypothetical protein
MYKKQTKNKYNTVWTIPKLNNQIDTPNAQIHYRSLSWLL